MLKDLMRMQASECVVSIITKHLNVCQLLGRRENALSDKNTLTASLSLPILCSYINFVFEFF